MGIEAVQRYGKVAGLYFGTSPVLSLSDATLVNQILVKDFKYFSNRIKINSYNVYWQNNLFSSNDQTWKRLRTICNPSFSTRNLKECYGLIQRCADNLNQHLEQLIKDGSNDAIIDVRHIFTGYSIDVISSTVFAKEINANQNPKSEFVQIAKNMFNFNPIRMWATVMFPTWLLKMLNIDSIFPPKPFNFLINWTRNIVEKRKSGQSEKRNDLLQLLVDACVDQVDLNNNNNFDDEGKYLQICLTIVSFRKLCKDASLRCRKV